MKSLFAIALFVGVSSLAGCDKSEKAAEADAAVAPSASASVAMTVDAGTPEKGAQETAIATIPTPDKADRKAAREITKTNYKTELDALEKEIGK